MVPILLVRRRHLDEGIVSLMDFASQLDDEQIQQLSEQIGAGPAQTRVAIEVAAPLLLAGVACAAQQPQAAAVLEAALSADTAVADNVGQLVCAGGNPDCCRMLDRVLGANKAEVHDGVQQSSGLTSEQSSKLLTILGPVLVAVLAKQRQQASHVPLTTHLREEAERAQEEAERTSPQIGAILERLLSYTEPERQLSR